MPHNHGWNPVDTDDRYEVTYGQQFTDADPLPAAIRTLLDRETDRPARRERNRLRPRTSRWRPAAHHYILPVAENTRFPRAPAL